MSPSPAKAAGIAPAGSAAAVSPASPVPASDAPDAAAALRDALFGLLAGPAGRPGQRLPTERALSQRHGLGRTAVRRVLQEFKVRGLLKPTVGSGTYVAEGATARLAGWRLELQQAQARQRAEADAAAQAAAAHGAATLAASISPAELMAARVTLEPAIVEMVVAHATPSDFARMDHCLEQAEAAVSLEGFEHWDAALHEAIAEAAHNGFVLQVFRLVGQARQQAEWGALKRRSVTPERRAAYQREHRALVQALQQRDAELARTLCLAHLLHVRRNLLGS
jgi:DNA-binding FadR family transcriptional regulator